MKKWDESAFEDFNFIETAGKGSELSRDYKSKIRRIEEFDLNVVGRLVSWLKNKKTPARVVVTSDVVHSSAQGANTQAHAPFLLWGPDIQASGAQAFTEKACGLAGQVVDPGHAFFERMLA